MAGELVKVDDEFTRLMGVANLTTSLDLTTQEGRERLAAALSTENPLLDGVVNTTIPLTDIVMRDMESVNDKTGQVETYKGVVLVCADGRCYFTGANGIRRSLFLLSLSRGKPPWNPPAEVIVKQRTFTQKSGGTGRTYSLELAPQSYKTKKG